MAGSTINPYQPPQTECFVERPPNWWLALCLESGIILEIWLIAYFENYQVFFGVARIVYAVIFSFLLVRSLLLWIGISSKILSDN